MDLGGIWAVILTGVIAAARLVANPRFYFADDTEVGAFGQWWQLGGSLLRGRIPVLDPHAWQAGNYFAEGQWGLINPVTWVVAVGARLGDDPVLHSAIVKIGFLMLMGGGVHLLARSFGAGASWAAVAAVLVPMGGFTVYMDAPSWATGLFNAAVLPWAWWGLRRLVEDDRPPLAYLIASYILITFGYIFGVLILVVVLVESLVRALTARNPGKILRTLVASVWGALLTAAVYLPAVLTAPVTERAGWEILNGWFLNADLSDLASAASPTASASIGSWFGPVTEAPLVYVAWVLPLIPCFLPMTRPVLERCIPLFVLSGVCLLAVIGPSDVGPLRWPVRFMPYLALAVLVVFAVAATHGFPGRVTRRGVGWSFIALAFTTSVTFANTPDEWRWLVAVAVIQALAILAVWILAHRGRIPVRARRAVAVGGILLTSGIMVLPQLHVFPATPLPKFGVPDSVERMQEVLADGAGDGIAVGDIYAAGGIQASFDERLMGNLWYLSPTPVSSLYTVLPYTTFARDLCMDLRGSTCAEALETLWSVDPETGESVADLMGVSTVVVMKATFDEEPVPAPGWRLVDEGEYTWVLQREREIASAGGVAWTANGTEVSVVEQTDQTVSFRVGSVGRDGRVVLRRLDYPGYAIDGAAHAAPLRGWLLTVDIADAEPGQVVTVSFRPPGFALMLTALSACAVILVGWPIFRGIVRRRAGVREVSEAPFVRPAAPGTPD